MQTAQNLRKGGIKSGDKQIDFTCPQPVTKTGDKPKNGNLVTSKRKVPVPRNNGLTMRLNGIKIAVTRRYIQKVFESILYNILYIINL